MDRIGSIGAIYVIDILILLARDVHEAVGHIHLGLLCLVHRLVEVSLLSIDSMLEDKRFARVSRLKFLDEREESFLNLLRCRIRERIENEGVHIRIHESISEV